MTAKVDGTIAHDSPNNIATNFPVLVGGVAGTQAPVLVSQVLDIVQAYFDLAGRRQVNQELGYAGENQALNVMRTVRGKLAVEQESWDQYNTTTTALPVAGALLKSGPGRLSDLHVLNTTGTQYYVWICNNIGAAATASAVLDRLILPADGEVRVDYAPYDGLYFDTGLYVALSTVLLASVTNPGVATGIIHATFI